MQNLDPTLLGAIQNADISRLGEMVEGGLRIETEHPEDGYTSLHYAATLGNAKVLELLLNAGGKELLNRFSNGGLTPLMCACESGHLNLVRLLIEAGSNVNAFDARRGGNTALREVVDEAGYDIVRCLVDAGADPTISGWMQLTALEKARERAKEHDDPESRRILELLETASRRPGISSQF